MKRWIQLAVLLLLPLLASAQAVRFSGNVYTLNTSAPRPGALYPVLATTSATVAICTYSSATCAATVTTYTDATATTACATTAQLTPPASGACTAVVDKSGNFGVWIAAGTYQYVVTSQGRTYGPYPFTVGGGGGGGSGTVTSFAAPSASWPTWLVPTVTNPTTTPSLAVAASPIPNAALANASTTVNGQTCTLGSTCTITTSFPSGITNQLLYYASSGTTLTPLNLGSNLSITSATLNAANPTFTQIGSGTNLVAAMLVGTGASLGPTGSGTVTANVITSTISAGTNVTITGTGTTLSPYVINSSGGGGGSVSITSSTGDLTVSPSPLTGTGTIDLNLAHANTWSALQTLSAGINLSGTTSPLQFAGSAGTAGQCPISGGAGTTPTWGSCGSGGSGISGLTAGYIPIAGSATTITANSHIDDGVTTAATLTATEPITITGSVHGLTIPAGTAVSGAAGKVVYASDATNGYAEINENNMGLTRVLSSQNVIYASRIVGVTPGVAVTPGSSATGTADSAAAINAAIAGGNIDLEVDSGFALSTSLVVGSNTTIHCTSPQYGFILQAAANVPILVNAHQNAPTTSNGTGGYLVSNQTDQNIKITGCTLNFNSTQSVTGTNGAGVPHSVTPGGLAVMGMILNGVNEIVFNDNTTYDSGAFSTLFSNDSNVWVTRNTILQPSPLVQKKNTDGIHFNGPWQNIWVDDNSINAGDDSIALNADDAWGSGEWALPNLANGNGISAHVSHNTLSSSFGVRVLDGTSLLDKVEILDTRGSICGNGLTMVPISGMLGGGNGNLGNIAVDGWDVSTSGTCNVFSQPYNIEIALNGQSISIGGVRYTNPAVNWPLLSVLSGFGKPNLLSLHDWVITTTSSTFATAGIIQTNIAMNSVRAVGIGWNDTVGGTSLFGGTTAPTTLTCSNYYGPSTVLEGGYAPSFQNGDCFTNTYSTVTYVNTIFNEASSGTSLAGTTPATCANGCTGTWTLASGTDFTYQTGGGINRSVVNPTDDYINFGHVNGTVRVHLAACVGTSGGGCQIGLRHTDDNNFIAINISQGGTGVNIFDVVGGTATLLHTIAGSNIGDYIITMSGATINVTSPGGNSGNLTTANTTATTAGLGSFTAITSANFTSFSVKSN